MKILDNNDIIRCLVANGEVTNIPRTTGGSIGRATPELRVVNKVNLDSICDSLVSGTVSLDLPVDSLALTSISLKTYYNTGSLYHSDKRFYDAVLGTISQQ